MTNLNYELPSDLYAQESTTTSGDLPPRPPLPPLPYDLYSPADLPVIDAETYDSPSEEERAQVMEDYINNVEAPVTVENGDYIDESERKASEVRDALVRERYAETIQELETLEQDIPAMVAKNIAAAQRRIAEADIKHAEIESQARDAFELAVRALQAQYARDMEQAGFARMFEINDAKAIIDRQTMQRQTGSTTISAFKNEVTLGLTKQRQHEQGREQAANTINALVLESNQLKTQINEIDQTIAKYTVEYNRFFKDRKRLLTKHEEHRLEETDEIERITEPQIQELVTRHGIDIDSPGLPANIKAIIKQIRDNANSLELTTIKGNLDIVTEALHHNKRSIVNRERNIDVAEIRKREIQKRLEMIPEELINAKYEYKRQTEEMATMLDRHSAGTIQETDKFRNLTNGDISAVARNAVSPALEAYYNTVVESLKAITPGQEKPEWPQLNFDTEVWSTLQDTEDGPSSVSEQSVIPQALEEYKKIPRMSKIARGLTKAGARLTYQGNETDGQVN